MVLAVKAVKVAIISLGSGGAILRIFSIYLDEKYSRPVVFGGGKK